MRTSRFDCPSASLRLKVLLERTRRVLWVGSALALSIHIGLSRFGGAGEGEKTAKPLTTKFVKRQPRLTKPLEMKKRPRPKQRRVERQMVAVRAKARQDQRATTLRTADVVGTLSRPRVDVSRTARFRGADMEPQEVAQHIESAKEPEHGVSLSLDMMDMEALDTGEYQAMVIQDPTDKTNIKGFFHIARLRSSALDFICTPQSVGWAEWIKNNSLVRLAKAVNQYTGIVTDFRHTFTPDDRKFLDVPLVFLMPSSTFHLTEKESQNLGAYLTSGGLLFADQGSRAEIKSLGEAVARALATQGIGESEWEAEPLPNDHPLFHCFFDFDAAPTGAQYLVGGTGDCPSYIVHAQLRAVVLEGRVAAMISEKWYTYAWGAYGIRPFWTGRPYEKIDPTRVLQFGVNIIVFGLTQEGSITHRLMESVK
jgi:hypothetical protein